MATKKLGNLYAHSKNAINLDSINSKVNDLRSTSKPRPDQDYDMSQFVTQDQLGVAFHEIMAAVNSSLLEFQIDQR